MPISQKKREKHNEINNARGGVLSCLALIDSTGFDSQEFTDFFESNMRYLMSCKNTATDFITLIIKGKNTETIYHLLSLLLDHSRMDIENDNPCGVAFLEKINTAINKALKKNILSFQHIVELGKAFQAADLAVSDELKESFVKISPKDKPALEYLDFETAISSLAQEIQESGGTAYNFFDAINGMTATMPQEAVISISGYLSSKGGLFFERCALYLLLSENKEVRSAVAWGLVECYKKNGLDIQTKKWLPVLRSWLPADTARDSVDQLNQQIRRKSQTATLSPDPVKIFTIVASIPDGVGAQSIGIGVKRENQYHAVFLLTKHGYGVKDAFTVPCESHNEVVSRLDLMSSRANYLPVAQKTLQMLIESALADNVAQSNLPAPGLLDVLETCDFLSVRPQCTELSVLLNFADTEKTVQSASPQVLGRWIKDDFALDLLAPFTNCWFEDTAETRQAMVMGWTSAAIERKIWAFMENRRNLWARRFLQAAIVFCDAGMMREWKMLTASAYGLMKGRALKRIPLIENIVYTTIEAGISHAMM